MGLDIYIFYLICFVVSLISEETAGTTSVREFFARAIPLQNQRLDSVPLKTVRSSSRINCLKVCIVTQGCVAFNYGSGGQCELLDTYVCQKTAALTPASDFTYYDVEDTVENIGMFDTENSCMTDGKCSPKCASCTWSSTFVEITDNYLVGFTMETIENVSKDQCKQRCLSATTFLCKSADYSPPQRKCFLSHINKDEFPDLFPSKSYTYLHRVCQ